MNTKNTNIIKISEDLSGQRIDNFLLKKLKGVPKKSNLQACEKWPSKG